MDTTRTSRWYPQRLPGKPKGVTLVIHGLNLRPEKMESMITRINEAGIDALCLSLRGHGENYCRRKDLNTAETRMASFKKVSYEIWFRETYDAYQQVKQRGDRDQVPVHLIGFSLGGLIGLDLFATESDVGFDRMVLLAPAVRLRGRNHLIRLLSPFPRLVIPSLLPEEYLANKGTPMAAYNAVFHALKHFERHMNLRINVPALLLVDKKDEIVSYAGLQKLVASKGFNQWKLVPVKKEENGPRKTMHHLIIDQSSTGTGTWRRIVDTMISHLLHQ